MSDLVQISTEDDEPDGAANAGLQAVAAEADAAHPDLPKNARLREDGAIELALGYPASVRFKKQDGSIREEPIGPLVFHRLTGRDLREMTAADEKDTVNVSLGRALRITAVQAARVFDAMDAADCSAAMAVIRFLSGNGAKTGR